MVRVSSPAKLRPWSELTAKMVMGVVPGLVKFLTRSSERSQPQSGGDKKLHHLTPNQTANKKTQQLVFFVGGGFWSKQLHMWLQIFKKETISLELFNLA